MIQITNFCCFWVEPTRINTLKRAGLGIVLVLVIGFLSACGGGSTGGGAGQEPGQEQRDPPEGPDLDGENWFGVFRAKSGSVFESITATIVHSGPLVTINTSRASGVAMELSGFITPSGLMHMVDEFDNEVWTTINGPASSNSVFISDFIFKGGRKVDTNELILTRNLD